MLEVTARVLNFRVGPGTHHQIIRGLERGTLLEVNGNFFGDWLSVNDMAGRTGWVHKNFVKDYDPTPKITLVEFMQSEGWRVTSPYGPRTGKYAGFHRGIDFGGRGCGHPIKTPWAGKVVAARTTGMGSWGNTVCVELSPDFVMLVAHQQLPMQVKNGQRVNPGDAIGLNGGTHHKYKGNHYSCHPHIEILNNNGSAPWRGTIWGDPAKFKF